MPSTVELQMRQEWYKQFKRKEAERIMSVRSARKKQAVPLLNTRRTSLVFRIGGKTFNISELVEIYNP